jgi:hypothetical protein
VVPGLVPAALVELLQPQTQEKLVIGAAVAAVLGTQVVAEAEQVEFPFIQSVQLAGLLEITAAAAGARQWVLAESVDPFQRRELQPRLTLVEAAGEPGLRRQLAQVEPVEVALCISGVSHLKLGKAHSNGHTS